MLLIFAYQFCLVTKCQLLDGRQCNIYIYEEFFRKSASKLLEFPQLSPSSSPPFILHLKRKYSGQTLVYINFFKISKIYLWENTKMVKYWNLVVNKLIWKCILLPLTLWPYSNHKVHIPLFEISTPPFELFRNLNSIWQQIIPIRCNKYCFIQLIRRIICQGCALLWN